MAAIRWRDGGFFAARMSGGYFAGVLRNGEEARHGAAPKVMWQKSTEQRPSRQEGEQGMSPRFHDVLKRPQHRPVPSPL